MLAHHLHVAAQKGERNLGSVPRLQTGPLCQTLLWTVTPHLTCVIGWWLPGDGGARQVGKDGIDAALTILWSR